MIITMYRRKWKFSVMSAEDAENFIRQPHFERIRFISITEANGHHIDFHKCECKIGGKEKVTTEQAKVVWKYLEEHLTDSYDIEGPLYDLINMIADFVAGGPDNH